MIRRAVHVLEVDAAAVGGGNELIGIVELLEGPGNLGCAVYLVEAFGQVIRNHRFMFRGVLVDVGEIDLHVVGDAVVDDELHGVCRWHLRHHAMQDGAPVAEHEAASVVQHINQHKRGELFAFQQSLELGGQLIDLVIASADGAQSQGIGGVDGPAVLFVKFDTIDFVGVIGPLGLFTIKVEGKHAGLLARHEQKVAPIGKAALRSQGARSCRRDRRPFRTGGDFGVLALGIIECHVARHIAGGTVGHQKVQIAGHSAERHIAPLGVLIDSCVFCSI